MSSHFSTSMTWLACVFLPHASIDAWPLANSPPIHALVLNAGYQERFTLSKTADGFDTTFQVNYPSHFLLTQLLLSRLDKINGCVLTIDSLMHEYASAKTLYHLLDTFPMSQTNTTYAT